MSLGFFGRTELPMRMEAAAALRFGATHTKMDGGHLSPPNVPYIHTRTYVHVYIYIYTYTHICISMCVCISPGMEICLGS